MTFAVAYANLKNNVLSISYPDAELLKNVLNIRFIDAETELEAACLRLQQVGWTVNPEHYPDLYKLQEHLFRKSLLLSVQPINQPEKS